MIVAEVIGNIWATRKYESLNGYKLMLTREIKGKNENRVLVAVDTIGAGVGDKILITEGSSARRLLEDSSVNKVPVDAVIVAIVDEDCPT